MDVQRLRKNMIKKLMIRKTEERYTDGFLRKERKCENIYIPINAHQRSFLSEVGPVIRYTR